MGLTAPNNQLHYFTFTFCHFLKTAPSLFFRMHKFQAKKQKTDLSTQTVKFVCDGIHTNLIPIFPLLSLKISKVICLCVHVMLVKTVIPSNEGTS